MWWKYVALFVVFLMLIFVLAFFVGALFSAQYKLYMSKLNHLNFAIHHSLIEKVYCKNIQELFKEIKQFECKYDFEIKQLEDEFKKRFKDLL